MAGLEEDKAGSFFSQVFLDAYKTGNVGVVLELLKGGVDPNQADEVRGITTVYSANIILTQYVSVG